MPNVKKSREEKLKPTAASRENISLRRLTREMVQEEVRTQLVPMVKKINALIEEIDNPKDKLDAIYKGMAYVIPKMQAVDVTQITEERELELEEKLVEMNKAAKYANAKAMRERQRLIQGGEINFDEAAEEE